MKKSKVLRGRLYAEVFCVWVSDENDMGLGDGWQAGYYLAYSKII